PIALKTHPLFKADGAMAGDKRGWCADMKGGSDENPWCGAQTTVQRWYADPVLDFDPGNPMHPATDRTLRTVFTHDHFGPSSHQHHGLYAALVVEPKDSTWTTLDGKPFPSLTRKDGGPTSYRANISVAPGPKREAYSRREYNMAFADFAILYNKELEAINPPNRNEAAHITGGSEHDLIPAPEGISGGDPGTQLINYRNEPIPLRIAEEAANGQFKPRKPADKRGMLDYAFSTNIHAKLDAELHETEKSTSKAPQLSDAVEKNRLRFLSHLDCGKAPNPTLLMSFYCEWWRTDGDPGTPVLGAYEGDPLQLRLIQGAQEEQHVFSMTGVKWPFQTSDTSPKVKAKAATDADRKASGYVNSQHIGISEHMEFDTPLGPQGVDTTDYLYMSSATDNLWDGMWGLLRAFGWKLPDSGKSGYIPNRPAAIKMVDLPDLKRLPVEAPRTNARDVCDPGTGEPLTAKPGPSVRFQVGAFLARDLLGPKGIVYNERAGLYDPNGIVFVNLEGLTGTTNVVEQLRTQYLKGKPFEPLVLRAAAGSCIQVELSNHIPRRDPAKDEGHDDRYIAPDTLRAQLKGQGSSDTEIEEHLQRHRGSYSMMPQITEGFNINETLPSDHVGLTPQLVEFNVRNQSGVNAGLSDDAGPVAPGARKLFTWYAGEHRFRVQNGKRFTYRVPMEFGAVSLRNLADPIKHTSHGAVGALIIEPEGSCYSYSAAPGGDSAEIVRMVDSKTPGELKKLRTEMVGDSQVEGRGYCDTGSDREMVLQSYRPKITADIYRNGKKVLRDFALIYEDDLSLTQNGHPLPNLRGGDDAEDSSGKAFNYHSEPLWARVGTGSPEVATAEMNNRDFASVLSSTATNPGCGGPCGDPLV
ncbi:MAG: manganese oxidase, partial [Bryobacterales bacterium]|nr:manganese oxidase [Bryobacterales bacterium]